MSSSSKENLDHLQKKKENWNSITKASEKTEFVAKVIQDWGIMDQDWSSLQLKNKK